MSSSNTPQTAEVESAREQISHPAPFTFLSLAPATSSSYPKPRTSSRASSTSSGSDGGARGTPAGLKFLKLGPVHDGEHLGENGSDWHQLKN